MQHDHNPGSLSELDEIEFELEDVCFQQKGATAHPERIVMDFWEQCSPDALSL